MPQVGMVIGSGGRTIRGLRESAGVENIQASLCLCHCQRLPVF